MKFAPLHRTLKNGITVLIREAQEEDAQALQEMVRTYIGQARYLLTTPSEFNLTVQQEAQWIRSFLMPENSLLLLAEHNGQLIGNIDLTGGQRNRVKHTSLIGIGMLEDWQQVGLGRVLLECAINWARQNPVVELLWLQCIAANAPALALYRKTGFEECGRQPAFFKLDETTYEDNVIMSLRVPYQ